MRRDACDCSTCRFYRRNPQSIGTGHCHYPAPLAVPVMMNGVPSVATVWPTVEAHDSCGQWSPTGEGAANG